jgi:cleavage stimulation factor subunit 3
MRELFPEDPSLDRFSHRYTTPTFDPVYVRPVLSPSQTQPKTLHAGVKPEIQTSPAPGQHDMSFSSPKRPYPSEDFDYDSDRPRKFVRAESPLKAAQGRRLDQQKRGQAINGQVTSHYKPQGSPAPLPREVVQLLNNIPHASAYHLPRLSPEKMVDLIRRTDIPASPSQIPLPANARGLGTAQSGVNAYGGKFGCRIAQRHTPRKLETLLTYLKVLTAKSSSFFSYSLSSLPSSFFFLILSPAVRPSSHLRGAKIG